MISDGVSSFFKGLLSVSDHIDVRSCRSSISLSDVIKASDLSCSFELDVCVIILDTVLVPISDLKNLSFEVVNGVTDPLLECDSVQIFNFDFKSSLSSLVRHAKVDSGFCGDIDFEVDYEIHGDFLGVIVSFFLEEV